MAKTKSTQLASKKLVLIGLGLIAAVLAGGALYIKLSQPDSQVANTQSEANSDNSGAVSEDQSQPAASQTATTPTANSVTSSSLAKPTLTKSSGNNGAIPAGVTVEFVCLGEPNLSCGVVLTDQASANRKIDLGTKTLSNDRSQAGASYNWTSQSGRWTVVATMSDGSRSSQSEPQTLVVE